MARKEKKERADRKDDDEEAPEELTLGQGREEAEKLQKEEKENERRVAAEAKLRRRLRSGPKNSDVQDIKTSTHEVILTSPIKQAVSDQKHVNLNAPSLKLVGGLDQDPDIGEEIQNIQLDRGSTFLDDNVVQYLTTREKRTHTTISDAQDNEMRSKPKIVRKKLHQDKVGGDGANRVELLMNKKSISYHAQTAVEFQRDQLYGTRVRRSHVMLAKLYRIPAKGS
ncbi:hypothetical protein O6H91_13G071100 [Diphasiastrum complanatum]|uniref:Uncharacterized protein n=1 Tax=Diphasiastrum complanatum TaxID=34168 RepID=A0ACC2BWD1_DIPCM|nr:hypothetical protein O6H91_13G071100 [Diphasiastrum complanatum]